MRWEQASEENNERQRELPFPATTPTSAGDFARGEQSSTLSSLLLRFIVSKWVKTATESTGPESTTNASETIRVRPYTRRTGRRDGSVRGDVTDDAASVKCLVVDNDFELFTGDDIDHHHAELDDSTGHEDSRTCTNRSRPHSFKSSKRSGMLDGTWQRLWIVKVWPVIKSIGDMSFPDKAQERSFQREQWHAFKPGAFAGSAFMILGTSLSLSAVAHWGRWQYGAYVGIAGTFTFLLPFFIGFNVYYRQWWVYQIMVWFACWSWPFILAIEVHHCGFFGAVNNCGQRTFLNFFALLSGVPTWAMMTLMQNRVLHLVGIIAWMIVMLALFYGEPKANLVMWRNVIMGVTFHIMFTGANYFREQSDRQLYLLRTQLKTQYRAVQSAQEMERRAEQTKRRFIAYIFHEVRVPLNAARLSLANLDAEGAFSKFKRDQGDLVIGLDVSLRMMENVLNDVLSFSRMESGSLILSSKPFNIHWTMQHVALAHRATAGAGNLSFTLELDPRVDAIGGVVFGDEMRFKQVLCNLVSNALKFTQQGSVKMVTKLLFPTLGTGIDTKSSSKDTKEYPDTPSEKNPATISVGSVDLSDPLPKVTSNPISKAVVRFEVHDTGPGLSLSDVSDNRLFSPYVQTEIGRRQGGKGSGLGLALVTQIVRLGRGRLGVDSQPGIGSVFWFELPFNLPTGAEIAMTNWSTPPMEQATSIQSLSHLFAIDDEELSSCTHLEYELDEAEEKLNNSQAHLQHDHPTSTATGPTVPPAYSTNPSAPSQPPAPPPPTFETPTRTKILTSSPIVTPPLSETNTALTCLVVDDDPLTRKLMYRMLSRMGHNIEMAEDGRSAFEILHQSWTNGPPIDIVFLDNQMPFMSGVEVARAVRALPSDLYIVGCTGNALREDQDEYLAAGADAIITKPISQTAILTQIQCARERRTAGSRVPHPLPVPK